MAEVVGELGVGMSVEHFVNVVVEVFAANARLDDVFDVVECFGDLGVGGELVGCGGSADGEGPADIGVVTADDDAEVEDEDFAVGCGTWARWAAGGGDLEVVAEFADFLADMVSDGLVDAGPEFDFGDAFGEGVEGVLVGDVCGVEGEGEEG